MLDTARVFREQRDAAQCRGRQGEAKEKDQSLFEAHHRGSGESRAGGIRVSNLDSALGGASGIQETDATQAKSVRDDGDG